MRKGFGILSILALTSSCQQTTSLEKAEWPQFGGSRQDFTVESPALSEMGPTVAFEIAWKKPLGKGYAGVSVAGGVAVTQFSDGTFDCVIALNATTGGELWRVPIDSTYRGHHGSVDGPHSTPLVHDGAVFAFGPKGQLLALALDDGSEKWSRNLVRDHQAVAPFYGFASSPMAFENRVILQTGGARNSAIIAFDPKTGDVLWAAGSDTIGYASATLFNVDDRPQVVCSGHKFLTGIDAKTGEQLWQYEHRGDDWPAGGQGAFPVLVGANRLFFKYARQKSKLIEITNTGGRYTVSDVWESGDIQGTINSTIYHDGYLYGYSGSFLNCVLVDSGESLWKSRPPGDGWLLLAGNAWVSLTKDGRLASVSLSPDGFVEHNSMQLFSDKAWTPVSFAYGRIYGRSLGEIASIAIRPATPGG